MPCRQHWCTVPCHLRVMCPRRVRPTRTQAFPEAAVIRGICPVIIRGICPVMRQLRYSAYRGNREKSHEKSRANDDNYHLAPDPSPSAAWLRQRWDAGSRTRSGVRPREPGGRPRARGGRPGQADKPFLGGQFLARGGGQPVARRPLLPQGVPTAVLGDVPGRTGYSGRLPRRVLARVVVAASAVPPRWGNGALRRIGTRHSHRR